MALKVGHLTLFSRTPKEIASFFSELLDLGITPDRGGEGIWLEGDSIKLFILPATADQLFHKGGERDLMVEFSLDDLSELEDLLHKVQFLSYRHSTDKEGQKASQKAQLSRVGGEVFFYLKDPDGRRWKFCWREEIS